MMYTSFKRWVGAVLTLLITLSPSLAGTLTPTTAQAATINSYIKGSASTVYWYSSNGKRYVLPNVGTFRSWVGLAGAEVTTVSDVELYTLPIGGNVTYRPGARLLKITTDPRVYAVSRYGVLRWVTSEAVARSIYGDNWNQRIDDISDDYFVNYTIGAPIYSSVDYNANTEFNAVLNPNDNISNQASVGGNSNNSSVYSTYTSIDLVSNRASLSANESSRSVLLTATVRNTSVSTDRIRIRVYDYNEGQSYPGTLLSTCEQTTSCAVTANIPSRYDSYTQRFMSIAEDRVTGQSITTNFYLYVPVYGSNTNTQSGTISLTADRSVVNVGDTNRTTVFTATVNSPTLPTERVRIQIVNENNNQVERTCNGILVCTLSYVASADTSLTLPYRAEYRDRDNNALIATSNRYTLTVYGTASASTNNRFTNNTRVTVEVTGHERQGTYDIAHLRVRMANPPISLTGTELRLRVNNTNADSSGYTGNTCFERTECLFDFGRDVVTHRAFQAEARDAYGNVLTSDWITVYFDPVQPMAGSFSSQTRLIGTLDTRTTNDATESIRYTARLSNNDGTLGNITIRIYEGYYDSADPVLATCNATRECSITLSSQTPVTRRLYARAWDGIGNNIGTNVLTITYGGTNNISPLPFQVTSAVTSADPTSCDNTVSGGGTAGAAATISTNGAGTVVYQWERSDGFVSNAATLSFSQAEAQTIHYGWYLSTPSSGWLRLKILSPGNLVSNQTTVMNQCNPIPTSPPQTVLNGSVYVSTDPGFARAGEMIRVDAQATFGQTSGSVKVDIYNQDGQNVRTCILTSSGSCVAPAARIPANVSGNYNFYAQIDDNAGHIIRSNWFPVRIIP